MKKKLIISILTICIIILGNACKNRQSNRSEEESIVLNEQSVTAFAQSIVENIYNGNADLFNNAVDQNNIKALISENSIVYSGFDVEGGQKFFESCLRLGDLALQTVDDGGAFSFVKYYQKEGQHHIVFRSYNDFIVNFADYVVDTVGGKLKITDGFIYNTGSLLSKNVEYSMLYNLMLQTNPDSEVQWLQKAEAQIKVGQYAQSLNTLKAHKDELKEFPLFYQLYIANLYKTSGKNFDSQLDLLKEDIDERYLLLHKLLYYTNEGKPDQVEETVNALIPLTGDDPIYLFMYAKSVMLTGNYVDALTCLENAESSLPIFWDLWACKLKCCVKTNNTAGYADCVRLGKEAFGLSDDEIQKMKF